MVFGARPELNICQVLVGLDNLQQCFCEVARKVVWSVPQNAKVNALDTGHCCDGFQETLEEVRVRKSALFHYELLDIAVVNEGPKRQLTVFK
jgi:hypothetical protein